MLLWSLNGMTPPQQQQIKANPMTKQLFKEFFYYKENCGLKSNVQIKNNLFFSSAALFIHLNYIVCECIFEDVHVCSLTRVILLNNYYQARFCFAVKKSDSSHLNNTSFLCHLLIQTEQFFLALCYLVWSPCSGVQLNQYWLSNICSSVLCFLFK